MLRTLTYNLRMMARYAFKRSALFHRSMADIAAFRTLDPPAQHARQLEGLRAMLEAAAQTRYYAPLLEPLQHFDDPLDQLKALPYLTKETVRATPAAFRRPQTATVSAHTSGSTGTPLRLRRDLYCVAREEAGFFCWHQSAGWSTNDEMIVMRGDIVADVARRTPPYGVRDVFFNRRVLSSYHLSDQTAPWYLDSIRRAGARFLSAYPSSAYVLADYIARRGLPPLNMRAVFLGSETVTPAFHDMIAAQIGPVHAHYGTAERGCWMTTCSAGCYHEDTQYGLTEYVPLGDGTYEIVATGLVNRAMPLLRYRTGDIALEPFGWEDRCACGRLGPGCAQIIGRLDDFIVTPDGRRIGRLDHIFKGVAHVVAAQILQYAPDCLELRIVRAPEFTPQDERDLRAHLAARVGADVTVQCTYIAELPRSAQGKFRAVVSQCRQPG
jgi:phenylacetate-CoA ligase